MSDERRDGPPEPDEKDLRRNLRVISGWTFLILLIVLVGADTFGQSSGLHASEFIFGSLLGALLLVAGVEGSFRIFGGKK